MIFWKSIRQYISGTVIIHTVSRTTKCNAKTLSYLSIIITSKHRVYWSKNWYLTVDLILLYVL